MSEDGHHKQINDERHKQGDRCLYEEVEVRLAHFFWLATINIAGLSNEP